MHRKYIRIIFPDCFYHFSIFKENTCSDGILSVAYTPLLLKGKNIFISNYGAAFRVSSITFIQMYIRMHDYMAICIYTYVS